MSRVAAGFVSAVGGVFGGLAGALIGAESAGVAGVGPMTPQERKRARTGAAIGGLIGAALGAAVGAGESCETQPTPPRFP